MRTFAGFIAFIITLSIPTSLVSASVPMTLPNDPALSPDGKTLAFAWNGDLWTVPTTGGTAQPLTHHGARDREPAYSPDGREIAFISDRDGTPQLYVMPAQGGLPTQLTFHTSGCSLEGWYCDGQSLLISGNRDQGWKHAERFFRVSRLERQAEQLLFDDYGRWGAFSQDGQRLLFTREGPAWWRKGYRGSQSQQIWSFDLTSKTFEQRLARDTNCSWPLWRPDGEAFYYVGQPRGFGELIEHEIATGKERTLTHFEDDSVVFPCISQDGSTIVFRHLFHFYRLDVGKDAAPVKIDIQCAADYERKPTERRLLQSAKDVAFTSDALELAFTAGGDLWVMDTELREPLAVTTTAAEERDPVFSLDHNTIYYVSDHEGQSDIWRATRSDEEKYWWQQSSFKTERLTQDAELETDLILSPDGTQIAYKRGRGDLWIMDLKTKATRRLIESWSVSDFDWSPDGKWMAYAQSDDDFNRDIWLIDIKGERAPYNVSRHPRNDYNPRWSPDGKLLAFVGQRQEEDTDLFYVWLQEIDDQTDRQDRAIKKATEKLDKARKRTTTYRSTNIDLSNRSPEERDEDEDDKNDESSKSAPRRPTSVKPPPPKVVIDWDRLHERVHRISVSSNQESGLFWSSDSKKLAFSATIDGKKGTYTVEFPDNLKATLLVAQTGSNAKWLTSSQIVWSSSGIPGAVSTSSGTATSYRFRARQEVNLSEKNAAVFDLAWRTLRDRFYDERMGNKNWDAVRRKYVSVAAEACDEETLATAIQLMLGELNASHMGFTLNSAANDPNASPSPPPTDPPAVTADPEPAPSSATVTTWRPTTKHLGVRFDPTYQGPGMRVRDVLPTGPADHRQSRIEPNDVILSINGVNIDPDYDLTQILNTVESDFHLVVRNAKGDERKVMLRGISWTAARALVYDFWVKTNRTKVDELSNNKLGYLHISGMNMPSFYRFEQELYSVGAGKQGLVIDVRENGGGSTTDHLLTALTQPTHAITVPRGGGAGYPHDRVVYAVWNKPVIVLCNQNSFSNAEIFAHAIKTLGRGKVVGVTTAGGVISTGSVTIMDVGSMRLPFRGWFHKDTGKDFELNGAVPDVQIWPAPGDASEGRDTQLQKAVELLLTDVDAWEKRPRPTLRKSSEF